jgi:hypothetical protein
MVARQVREGVQARAAESSIRAIRKSGSGATPGDGPRIYSALALSADGFGANTILDLLRQSREKVMAKDLNSGDEVSWETSQGETRGKVLKRQSSGTRIKTHKVAASKDSPQYIVQSNKSGKIAAHKLSALKKR